MGGVWLHAEARQETLQTDARPASRADEVAAHGVRDACKRDELMHWFVTPKLIQRQLQRPFNHAADLQSPSSLVKHRRASVGVDAVVLLERRELRTGAGYSRDESSAVWQRMVGGPAVTGVDAAPVASHHAPQRANEGRGRSRTGETNQEPAAVHPLRPSLRAGSAAECVFAGFTEPVVHPAEDQSPCQKGCDNPGAMDERATWYPIHLLLDEQCRSTQHGAQNHAEQQRRLPG